MFIGSYSQIGQGRGAILVRKRTDGNVCVCVCVCVCVREREREREREKMR